MLFTIALEHDIHTPCVELGIPVSVVEVLLLRYIRHMPEDQDEYQGCIPALFREKGLEGLSEKLAWDMYHIIPRTVGDVRLVEFAEKIIEVTEEYFPVGHCWARFMQSLKQSEWWRHAREAAGRVQREGRTVGLWEFAMGIIFNDADW